MKCVKSIFILFIILYLRCCLNNYIYIPSSVSDNFDRKKHWFNSSEKNGLIVNNFTDKSINVHYFYGYSSDETYENMYEVLKEDAYGRLYTMLGRKWHASFLFPQRGPKILWIMFPRMLTEKERTDFLVEKQEQNYCLWRQERDTKDGVLLGCIHENEACHFYFNIYDINKTDNSISMSCRDKRKNELFYRW